MAKAMRLHRLEYLHARRRFVAQEVRNYNMLKEAGLLTWRIEGDTLSDLRDFEQWWKSYWKNSTDTVEHTISRSIAYDAWWAALRNNP